MSHNVLHKDVQFTNVALLKQAYAELKRDEPLCHDQTFVTDNAVIRGWAGRKTPVDIAILCPSQAYDLGFQKQTDGSYIPLMESGFMAHGISSPSGVNVDGTRNYGSPVGLLQQRFAVITAEANAQKLGAMTRRVHDKTNGNITLEVVPR